MHFSLIHWDLIGAVSRVFSIFPVFASCSPVLSLSDNMSFFKYDVTSCLRPDVLTNLSSLSRSTRILYLPLRWEEVTVDCSLYNTLTALIHAHHVIKSCDIPVHHFFHCYYTLFVVKNRHSFGFLCCLLSASGISLNCSLVTIPSALAYSQQHSPVPCGPITMISHGTTQQTTVSLSLFFLFYSALYWTNTQALQKG